MVAVGHLIGYAAGTVDLLKIFGTTLGGSQFKQLTVIAGAFLIITVGITSYAVKERILISSKSAKPGQKFHRFSANRTVGMKMLNQVYSR